MIVVCSWCNATMPMKPPLEDTSITHGICADCQANPAARVFMILDDDEKEKPEKEENSP